MYECRKNQCIIKVIRTRFLIYSSAKRGRAWKFFSERSKRVAGGGSAFKSFDLAVVASVAAGRILRREVAAFLQARGRTLGVSFKVVAGLTAAGTWGSGFEGIGWCRTCGACVTALSCLNPLASLNADLMSLLIFSSSEGCSMFCRRGRSCEV